MTRRSLAASRIVVTGASSGIGRALALELAGRGARLLLNARREERLQQLAGEIAQRHPTAPPAHIVAGDIADTACRQAIVDECRNQMSGLDILINNAGLGAYGRFETASTERMRRVMEVNFFAPVELTRLALPLLLAGVRPMVVNVGSILGHRGVPWSIEYCASKFAIQGFSESLRAELARRGVDVLVVNPGTTETDFFSNVIEQQGTPAWNRWPGVKPEHVARQTVRAIERGRHEIIPSFRGRWLVRLNRLAPRLLDRVMARYG